MKKLTTITQLLILTCSLWMPTPGQRIEHSGDRVQFVKAIFRYAPSAQRKGNSGGTAG
jgi:hypothetical protein